MKKQDFKKWTFGLAGGFVVIAGALASCFYLTYGELDSRLAEANAKLLNAQKQVETLTAEKEELEEEAGIVAAMAEENALLKMEKIPFEVEDVYKRQRFPCSSRSEPTGRETRSACWTWWSRSSRIWWRKWRKNAVWEHFPA